MERILTRVKESERQAMRQLSEEERRTLLAATQRYVAECKKAMKEL